MEISDYRKNAESRLEQLIAQLKALEQQHQDLLRTAQEIMDRKQMTQNMIISAQASVSSFRLAMGEEPMPNTLVDGIVGPRVP